MYFLFIDDTGDPGKQGSPYFGLALLGVHSNNFSAVRHCISHYRWLSGIFSEVKQAPQRPVVGLNLLRGISSMLEEGLIHATGLYLDKANYGGRYVTWADYDVPESDWSYYLRNYLTRHLLEMHFAQRDILHDEVELVLDRILLTEKQRANMFAYLNGNLPIPLKQPFSIPPIKHLTIADSEYVEALQITHILADVVNSFAKGECKNQQLIETENPFRIAAFMGHYKK